MPPPAMPPLAFREEAYVKHTREENRKVTKTTKARPERTKPRDVLQMRRTWSLGKEMSRAEIVYYEKQKPTFSAVRNQFRKDSGSSDVCPKDVKITFTTHFTRKGSVIINEVLVMSILVFFSKDNGKSPGSILRRKPPKFAVWNSR